MAIPQVKELHHTLTTGTTFSVTDTVKNPDGSAVDISACTFVARFDKNGASVDANASTVAVPVPTYTEFTTTIVSGVDGEYNFALTPAETAVLSEGKYVYYITMEDANGVISEIRRGLLFVTKTLA